jgi:AcrR family transcriptional regulator
MPTRRKPPAGEQSAAEPRPYHHGKLKEVLVEASLALAEEVGVEQVTVRAAARRAGVSPGAPFRHFADREALMAAAAAEALGRFRREIDAALAAVPPGEPLARFRAFGLAYLRWALRNPAHFQILSTRGLFDLEEPGPIQEDNASIIAMVEDALAEAAQMGLLRFADPKLVVIAARSLVYGFARMAIDGHFPRWGVDAQKAEGTAEAMVDFFIAAIARQPSN